MNKTIIIAIIAIVLLGGVFFVLTSNRTNQPGSQTSQPSSNQDTTISQDNSATNDSADATAADQHSSDDNSDDGSLNDTISSL